MTQIGDVDFMSMVEGMFPGVANYLRSLAAGDGCMTEFQKGEALGEMLAEIAPIMIGGGGNGRYTPRRK